LCGDGDRNLRHLGHNGVLRGKFTEVAEELAVWTTWSMKMEAVSFSETSTTIHEFMMT